MFIQGDSHKLSGKLIVASLNKFYATHELVLVLTQESSHFKVSREGSSKRQIDLCLRNRLIFM